MMLIKSKCELLKNKLRDSLPYVKIDYTYNRERDYCVLYVKDKELGQIISKRARKFYPPKDADIIGSAGGTNSVQIIDNKISTESQISYVTDDENIEPYKSNITGTIWSFKGKEYYIDTVHIHDGGIPESHIHASCNSIDDEQITYIVNIMKNVSIASRRIAKLKV